jgi:CheY-like chemotaxis protein
MRALSKRHLANHVVHVTDGQAALDFLFREGPYTQRGDAHPQVVLLDLKLPKVDGIEVLRQIRGDQRLKTLPVVVLTSSREESDIVKTYRLGVNSYIVKPVEFENFSEAVSNLGFYWLLLNQPPLL